MKMNTQDSWKARIITYLVGSLLVYGYLIHGLEFTTPPKTWQIIAGWPLFFGSLILIELWQSDRSTFMSRSWIIRSLGEATFVGLVIGFVFVWNDGPGPLSIAEGIGVWAIILFVAKYLAYKREKKIKGN